MEVDNILVVEDNQEADKVIGLSMGAYDYIIKPFFVRELTVRVKVQLRRSVGYNSTEARNSILQHDELKLDTLNYKIFNRA